MKSRVLLSVVILLGGVLPALSQTYRNPVIHQDFSDPDVCRTGDDYWMTASSFNCFPGLPILHSRDLVHWEQAGSALTDYPGDGSTEFRDSVMHGCGVWAPAIRFHEGWYYIFCGDPDRGIFMVRTRDPRGRWEAPVWLVRQKGFIDPCPFWDDDGRAWLSHAAAGSRAGLKSVVFVAEMSPDGTSLLEPSRIVFDGHDSHPTIEGTKMYKRDGYYYIFAPAGGVSAGWQTVLRSKHPYGPYEDRIVMASAPGTINGPHQGAWVDTPEGEDWFIHFQDKGAYGRIVHLQPMSWDEDGWPVIGIDPDGDGTGQPVGEYPLPVPEAPSALFAGESCHPYGLPYGWQYPAVPSPYWHYVLPDGGIRLFSAEYHGKGLWDCPNLLLQKFPAEGFTITAMLLFVPNPSLKEKGETAGLVVFGEDYAGLRLVDSVFGAKLQSFRCEGASKGGQEKVKDIDTLEYYEDGSVELTVRLEVSARKTGGPVPDAVCRFSYSVEGGPFRRVGTEFTASPGLWVGARWGFYCTRNVPKNDSGHVDVLDLKLELSEPSVR